jgi:hypothetical protein
MDDRGRDDPDPPGIAEPPVGYLTLVARVWIDTGHEGMRVRGTLTDAHTGAQLPLDLTALVAFVRTSLANVWGEPLDDPPR